MKKLKRVLLFVAMPLAVAATMSMSSYSSGSGEKCPAVDPPDHVVMLPNPDDCSSFFMCSNGVPILQKCPEGLHFNPHLGVCGWPDKKLCDDTGGGSGSGGGGVWNPYCHAGGPGATSCSIDGGIDIKGAGVSVGCSVSCGSGYYACCGIRCTCKPN